MGCLVELPEESHCCKAACLQYTNLHRDIPQNFWNKVIWSDETKIGLFWPQPWTLHLEMSQQGLWWKAHHSYCETWRWIAEVLGTCELQRHRVKIDSKINAACYQKILEEKFALISPEAAHGTYLDVPTWQSKTQGQVDLSLATAEKMKLLEWPSQSPGLNNFETLWGDLKHAVHARQPKNVQGTGSFLPRSLTIWKNKVPHPQLPENTFKLLIRVIWVVSVVIMILKEQTQLFDNKWLHQTTSHEWKKSFCIIIHILWKMPQKSQILPGYVNL